MNTKVQHEALLRGITSVLKPLLSDVFRRIKALESREIGAEAFARAYKGTYKAGATYIRGSLLTHGGGLWIANQATDTKPGTGPHWTLIVKAGRDAR